MDKELEAVIGIIKQAGEIILKYHGGNELNTKFKVDQFDPVTQADLESDRFIRAEIHEKFPDDKILSEETENDLVDFSGRVWMIDPLDGTKDFVGSGDRYSIMIGLCVDGEPKLGVVFCPSTGDLYYAKNGTGAFFLNRNKQLSPQRIEVSKINEVEEARYFTKSKFSEKRSTNEKIEGSFHFREIFDGGSVGIVVGEIARGVADCYILTNKRGCKRDSCAPQVILQEAGGRMTDVFGNDINYLDGTEKLSNLLVATNGRLHEKIIERTKEIFKDF